ncbi:hypothetical protein EYF80_018253 [Liparis tanakae]|uniref:Uncharacterized protein n=1 Tax=Liparis tanakae TaxID=230148 RepID=A0A4Z2I0T6_9TELE|nr:hypothetical protein EYF80_018253 [Liparis tanakae]
MSCVRPCYAEPFALDTPRGPRHEALATWRFCHSKCSETLMVMTATIATMTAMPLFMASTHHPLVYTVVQPLQVWKLLGPEGLMCLTCSGKMSAPFTRTEHRLEAVAPKDLVGHVGAPTLGRHGRSLHHALQDHHDLELCRLQLLFAHLVEGAVLVDLVHNGDWRHQEDSVDSTIEAHVDVDLIQRDKLSLGGGAGLQ